MSTRSIMLILTAVLLVAGTVYLARNWLEGQRSQFVREAAPKQTHQEVLVAKADLHVGTFLKRGDLRWQVWPDEDLPQSYMVKGKTKEDDLYGTVVRRSFSLGEPITADRLIRPGDRGFLAAVLQAGYRAVAIPIGAASGIAGLVFPGDRVDIIMTHKLEGEDFEGEQDQARASETVLTNVRVLALDQKVDDQSGKPKLAKTATLEVTPKQAEILAVAHELGVLSLALRSLAKDQAELDRIARGEDVPEESNPEKGQSFTWDSDASLLVPDRTGADAMAVRVTVARGAEQKKLKFRRTN